MERYRVTLFIIIVVLTWFLFYTFFKPPINQYYQPQTPPEQIPVKERKYFEKVKPPSEIFTKSVSITSEYLKLNFATAKKTIKFESELLKFKDTRKNNYRLIHDGKFRFNVNNKLAKIHSINAEDNKVTVKFLENKKLYYSLTCKLDSDYLADCDILVENKRNTDVDVKLHFVFVGQIFGESNSISDIEFIYGYIFRDSNFKFKRSSPTKQFTFKKKDNKQLKWIGFANKYFVHTFVSPEEYALLLSSYENISQNSMSIKSKFKNVFIKMTVRSKTILSIPFKMYTGPKQKEFLDKYKSLNLNSIYNFGFFDSISKFLFLILKFLYDIFKNYGIAIIFLTLIVRLCLFPVSVIHQRSINKLQAVQPLIQKLQEKYKNNKEKLQKEFKKVYTKYKINPLMGCLPLFIQIPILFGLFNLFNYAIELRSSHFAFWINDLSQPDKAINLKRNFLGDKYLHILPILNIIVWIFQIITSKTSGMGTPTGASSESEKTMKFAMYLMPLFFGFALYNAPSGLNLYWLFTTCFSIAEGFFIKRMLKKETIIIDE